MLFIMKNLCTTTRHITELKSRADCPVTEEVCRKVLSLPMHPWLTENDQCKIASVICSAI